MKQGKAKTNSLTISAAAIFALMSGPATAQFGGGNEPNTSANPLFGTLFLDSGFLPDPAEIEIQAGGSDDARIIGSNCVGQINFPQPDVTLKYNAGRFPLTIFADSESDTTLAVFGPDRAWHCNDDSDGLNPAVTFDPGQTGVYQIWVGTFDGGLADATLQVTEIAVSFTEPDFTAAPLYATLNLRSGFLPDPEIVDLTAGGGDDASNLGFDCVGDIYAAAPDVRLNYSPGVSSLYLYVTGEVDSTLVVNTPDGNWVCNDDGNHPNAGTNPLLVFDEPLPGQYDIWVGTFTVNGNASLYISEIQPQF